MCEQAPLQSSLKMSGFPDVSTPEAMQNAVGQYRLLHEHFMIALYEQTVTFDNDLIAYKQSPDAQSRMHPILSKGGESYNRLRPEVLMELRLHPGYLEFSKQNSFAEAEKLTMPKAVIALVDFFFFSAGCNSISRDAFIIAHIGSTHEVVTETAIFQKYKTSSSQSLADFPQAGMRRAQRNAMRTNMASLGVTLVNQDVSQVFLIDITCCIKSHSYCCSYSKTTCSCSSRRCGLVLAWMLGCRTGCSGLPIV